MFSRHKFGAADLFSEFSLASYGIGCVFCCSQVPELQIYEVRLCPDHCAPVQHVTTPSPGGTGRAVGRRPGRPILLIAALALVFSPSILGALTLDPPSSLVATAVSPTEVDLAWVDNNTNEEWPLGSSEASARWARTPKSRRSATTSWPTRISGSPKEPPTSTGFALSRSPTSSLSTRTRRARRLRRRSRSARRV